MLRSFSCWILIPFVFLFDRILKIWVLLHLREGEGFPVWTGVFHITRVNNAGAAFGLWKNSPVFLILVSALSLIFIGIYLSGIFRQRTPEKKLTWAERGSVYGWALVAGGALGNLYDRIHFGYVIDFIDLRIWPVFNIADSSICIGVFWILLSVMKQKKIT